MSPQSVLSWLGSLLLLAAPQGARPIAVTDEQLGEAFLAGTANARYGGKTLEVTGTVRSAGTNNSGDRVMVQLAGAVNKTATRKPEALVECRFPQAATEAVLALAPGQKVKFRGTYMASVLWPILTDCTLAEAGKSPAVRATVAELAAARGKAAQAYHGKPVLLRGKVVGARWYENLRVTFTLADPDKPAAGKVHVVCRCEYSDKVRDRLKAVKDGQVLVALGVAKHEDGGFTVADANLLRELPKK